MTVHGCQLDIAWENKSENFQRVRALLHQKKISGGSLVVLPEMFATGFSMDADAIAEQDDEPTVGFLRKLAREKKVFLLAGLVRSAARGRNFNEAVCMDPAGHPVARYSKLHLFSPGGESRHYAPGARVTLFQWNELKAAVFICYDLRFPEIFRMAVQRGAGLLVVIANWPAKRHAHWTALLRARAIENQAYILGVNRCGKDPQHEYLGGSIIFNPWGETVAEAGPDETILSARLDLNAMNRLRLDFPVLRDARTRFVLQ
jgi:omega-amidase